MNGPLCSLEGRNKSYMKVLDVHISKFLAPKSLAFVDQLAERLTSNPKDPGSIPGRGS